MSQGVKKLLLTNIPTAQLTDTVGEVRRLLFARKRDWESVNYIYVLDSTKHLKGVVSIKELLSENSKTKMMRYKKKVLATGRLNSRMSVIAGRAIKNNVKAVPIVSDKNVFLGAIGTDAILDELERLQARELLQLGVSSEKRIFDVLKATTSQLIKWRAPWIFLGLIGGLFLTSIVSGFEHQLQKVVELAFFIPLMVYMGAAVGNQTQLLYIRGLAFGEVNTSAYIRREIRIDFIIGILAGSFISLFAYLLTGSVVVAGIVSISMFIIVSTAGSVSVLSAMLFKKFTKDPALGGGPVTTIIQDTLSLLIYFLIASIGLAFFG